MASLTDSTIVELLKENVAVRSQHIGAVRSISLIPDGRSRRFVCRIEPVDPGRREDFARFFKGREIGSGVYFEIPFSS